MEVSDYFKGKRVTVMGLGLLGGVGDIKFLAENGADIVATDLQSADMLRPSLEILEQFPNIRYTLGKHDLADFQDRDLIIKAPSTPLDSIYIAEARKNGIEITMWAALFARFARAAGATLVGVTGTRGKTTVTAMIVAILRAAGKKVIEGGNVQGTSMLPQLAALSAETISVLELDSWKLQGFREEALSPDIAVFTTFYPDHMNYYRQAREQVSESALDDSERALAETSGYGEGLGAYLDDKASIFINQTAGDTLILGKQCAPTVIEKYGEAIESKTLVIDTTKLPEDWILPIPGAHNRYNAALALAAVRVLGISDEVSRKALEVFPGVPGRLEFIASKDGVKIYNDTTSTTPEATIAALNSFDPAHTIVIVGGTDKKLDSSRLALQLKGVKRVVLLAGSGTERIKDQLPDASIYGTLSEAADQAFGFAEPGDIILFSPGFTSFEMFKNEYDRGEQFNALVRERA